MVLRGARLVAVVCGSLLPLTACTGGGSDDKSDSASTPAELDTFYNQEVVWGGCLEMKGECTGVNVPLDYEDPEVRTVSLSVRRISATGESAGTLFFNPGGPGVSGVKALTSWARSLPDEVRQSYDLVGFDPRGVADSEGVNCAASTTRRAVQFPDQTPDSAAEESDLSDWYERLGRGCVEWDRELAQHLSSVDTARDLDVLRGVIGGGQLNYVGVSYGTVIGAHYVELFPEEVGRVVLDSAVDTSRFESENALDEVRGHRRVLGAYIRDCLRRRCPLGLTRADAVDNLLGFLAKLDSKPIPVADGARLTENDARAGIEYGLASGDWRGLTRALKSALDGDADALYKLAGYWYGAAPSRDVGRVEGIATLCSDSRERLNANDVRTLAERFRRESPVFGEYFAWFQSTCSGWPLDPPAERPTLDGEGAAPVLVVGSRGDPITPHRQSVAVAEQLDSAVLLTARTYRHGVYPGSDRCIDEKVDAYLLEGTVPDDGTEC